MLACLSVRLLHLMLRSSIFGGMVGGYFWLTTSEQWSDHNILKKNFRRLKALQNLGNLFALSFKLLQKQHSIQIRGHLTAQSEDTVLSDFFYSFIPLWYQLLSFEATNSFTEASTSSLLLKRRKGVMHQNNW